MSPITPMDVLNDLLGDFRNWLMYSNTFFVVFILLLTVLVVLAICLAPFLQLGCHYLIYKCAAALTATVTPGSEASLIDAIGSAFALVLGMTGGGGMILYAALITSIKAVSGG